MSSRRRASVTRSRSRSRSLSELFREIPKLQKRANCGEKQGGVLKSCIELYQPFGVASLAVDMRLCQTSIHGQVSKSRHLLDPPPPINSFSKGGRRDEGLDLKALVTGQTC